MPPPPFPAIVAVSDRRRLPETARPAPSSGTGAPATAAFASWCGGVARAGATAIYVREPDLESRALATLVRGALEAVAGTGCTVLVRNRADLLVATSAPGLHLSSDGMPAARVRAMLGEAVTLGRSVHAAEEAERVAAAGGCDYLLLGTVFPSATKGPGHRAGGLTLLERTARRVSLPIVAIGGIDETRAAALARSGARGVAGIGLFAPAPGEPHDRWTARLTAVIDSVRAAFAGVRGVAGGDRGSA